MYLDISRSKSCNTRWYKSKGMDKWYV